MGLYPHSFNSDTTLKPKDKKKGVSNMKCGSKKTTKKTSKGGGKKC